MVFAHCDDKVMKVSRWGQRGIINKEASVLAYLNEDPPEERVRGLPTFEQWGDLTCTIGGVRMSTP